MGNDYEYLNEKVVEMITSPEKTDDSLREIADYYGDSALSVLCGEYVNLCRTLKEKGAPSRISLSKLRFLANQIHLSEQNQAFVSSFLSEVATETSEPISEPEPVPDPAPAPAEEPDSISYSEPEPDTFQEEPVVEEETLPRAVNRKGDQPVQAVAIPSILREYASRFLSRSKEAHNRLVEGIKSLDFKLRPSVDGFWSRFDRKTLLVLTKLLSFVILIALVILGFGYLRNVAKYMLVLAALMSGYALFKTHSLTSLKAVALFCLIWILLLLLLSQIVSLSLIVPVVVLLLGVVYLYFRTRR